MSLARASRFSRTALAAALAFVLAVLAPGLAPYEAAAQLVAGSAAGSASHAPATVVLPGAGVTGGVETVTSVGILAQPLHGTFSPSFLDSSVFSPVPVLTALPISAVQSEASLQVEDGLPSVSAVEGVALEPSQAPALAASSSKGSSSQLSETVRGLSQARSEADKPGLLDKLFIGARRSLGFDERPSVSASVAASRTAAPALSAFAAAASTPDKTKPASGEKPFAPLTPVRLEGRGLQPGEKFLSTDSKGSSPAHAPEGPSAGDDWIDGWAVTGMFLQRTVSIAAFIVTSLAYPIIAIQAVGQTSFGWLMALGPMAAIATGRFNGLIVDKMSPRNGLILLSVLRAALAFALPAFSFFGILNFGTLLLASIANGWQLSLLMTSEPAFFRRMAGRNHIENINSGASVNYFFLQVLMTLLVGIGSYVDKWNPMAPFVASTLLHLFVSIPIIWALIPNVLPAAKEKAAAAVRSFGEAARDRVEKVKAFLRKNWKEIGLAAASLGAFIAFKTTIPMSAALLWWVSRAEGFKTVWAQKNLRSTILFQALVSGLVFPFMYMGLPIMAGVIGGGAGKAAILGPLTGALFFGQFSANASQIHLPLFGRKIPVQRAVQAAVAVMAAAWSFLRLFPASWPAALGAAAVAAGLMYVGSKFTSRSWVKSLGVGLAAASLAPLFFWGHMPVIFVGMTLLGFFVGPTANALNSYLSLNAKESSVGNAFGVSSSVVNTATSFGYGFLAFLFSRLHMTFPGVMLPVGLAFLAVGAAFVLAPKFLPGLPGKNTPSVLSSEKK